jgi:hypothetical protein
LSCSTGKFGDNAMSDAFRNWWMREGAAKWAKLVDTPDSGLKPWEMMFEAGVKEQQSTITALQERNALLGSELAQAREALSHLGE